MKWERGQWLQNRQTFPEMISKERDGSKLVSPLFAFTYCQNSSLIPFLSKALWAFFKWSPIFMGTRQGTSSSSILLLEC